MQALLSPQGYGGAVGSNSRWDASDRTGPSVHADLQPSAERFQFAGGKARLLRRLMSGACGSAEVGRPGQLHAVWR